MLSLAMLLEGIPQNSEFILPHHQGREDKRYGLLIDPGAASGFVGSETLRDLMAWCISEDKREDHATCASKTTSVAGISGESDQTLGEASLKLSIANRPNS